MGTSFGQGVSEAPRKMRAFIFVFLAATAMADSEPKADSDADAYTIPQVAHGAAYGVVTGVDYGHGIVSGYGAIGNRGYLSYGGYLGKREADSEPKADADAYTPAQVHYGLPLHNAIATGHAHNPGVITGYSHGGYGGYLGYGGFHGGYLGKCEADSEPKADADAYTPAQVHYGLPLHDAIATGHAHNPGVITGYS